MKATFELLWLIPFLPLLGALLNGALSLGGARSAVGPNRGFVSLIAVLMPGLSFVLTVIATIKLSAMQTPGVNNVLAQDLWSWFAIEAGGFKLNLSAGLAFDLVSPGSCISHKTRQVNHERRGFGEPSTCGWYRASRHGVSASQAAFLQRRLR